MVGEYEHQTQRESVGEATAEHHLAVGFLKGNTLTPKKEVVVPPYSIETLVENHVPVIIERGLGAGADFIDLDYADAGAIIEDDTHFIYQKSDIIVSLRPLTIDELAQLRDNQILVTPVTINEINSDLLTFLQMKKITALSLRLVRNVDGGEFLQDILHVEGGLYAAGSALGDYLLSLIFPLIFSDMRHAIQANPVLTQAVYCYKGILTQQEVAAQQSMPWQDLLRLCWNG